MPDQYSNIKMMARGSHKQQVKNKNAQAAKKLAKCAVVCLLSNKTLQLFRKWADIVRINIASCRPNQIH